MHSILRYMLIICSPMLYLQCGGYSLEDEDEKPESDTESSTYTLLLDIDSKQNAQISFPMNVFLFNDKNNCIQQENISNTTDEFAPKLPTGQYTLVLLSGLSESGCSWPLEIITDSYLSLDNSHTSHTALQMGQVHTNLTQSGKAKVTLSYIVSAIYISLYAIPSNVENVTVSLSPLSSGITFNGNYTNDGAVCNIPCSLKDGVWKAGPIYVFPSPESKPHLSIQLTTPDGNEAYGYSYDTPLRAGVPYHFSGTLSDGVLMDGTCQSQGWETVVDDDFEFDEIHPITPGGGEGDSGQTDDDNNGGNNGSDSGNTEDTEAVYVTEIPSAGTVWKNTYILAIDNATDSEAEALVIAPEQWLLLASEAEAELASYQESGLTGWRTFTAEEAKNFTGNFGNSLSELNDQLEKYGMQVFSGDDSKRYLCENCQKTFSLFNNRILNAGKTVEYYVRPVKTIRFRLSP